MHSAVLCWLSPSWCHFLPCKCTSSSETYKRSYESSQMYCSLWRWLQVCRSELHFVCYNRREVDTNYRLLTLFPSKATSSAQVSFRKLLWKPAPAKCVKWKIQLDAFSGQNAWHYCCRTKDTCCAESSHRLRIQSVYIGICSLSRKMTASMLHRFTGKSKSVCTWKKLGFQCQCRVDML